MLEDISFVVPREQFCAIVGPSGCGKSTLLRILGDLLPVDAGRVTVHGSPVSALRAQRQFGFVFQDAVLMLWRTVLKNIELPMEVAGVPRHERRARAMKLLELVELADFADVLPAKLSGGMARRVAIARALALEPEVLLLDEPFGALDEITRQRMNVELLRIWSETKTTAILVTHNISEAVYLSDCVMVMGTRPGRIIDQLAVDLPRPRTLDVLQTREFFEYTRRLTGLLYGSSSNRGKP